MPPNAPSPRAWSTPNNAAISTICWTCRCPLNCVRCYDAMDNDTRNRGKATTVCDLVRRSAEHRPCLVIIEDVHWASPIVLLYLARLAETAAQCRALLMHDLTHRGRSDRPQLAQRNPWRAAHDHRSRPAPS